MGCSPVDEGAHFYGVRMVDGHGNRIVKRNAWATRAVAWVNLIPPGAADVAHFRLEVPQDAGDEIRLSARLNYRKFSHANTMFSFAGVPAPGEPAAGGDPTRVTPHFDDRVFVVSFVSNVLVAGLVVFLGDQLGVGGQLSTGVVVVLGIRIFTNAAAIRRHLFHA